MSDDNNRKGKEEDEVAEAYESISKKLEHLRGDKDEVEDDDKEESKKDKEEDEVEESEELEESEEKEESEKEDKEDEKPETKDEEPEEESLDPLPGTDEKEEKDEEPKPTFKPRENDPLDEEVSEEEASQPDKEETDEYEEPASPHKTARPEEDLDDLVNESASEDSSIPHIKPAHKESSFPQRPDYASDISFSKPSYTEPNPSNYFNRHATDRPARRGNIWHLLILILIGLAVIGGTVYLLKYQFGGVSGPAATPEPTPTISEPTPEPTPAFDRSKFKIRVLNGTKTSGLAKTVSDKLKELGYQIDKTGNAPKQDFKSSVIKVKSSATGLADELIKDLGSEYSASASGELKDSDAADAEVILGTK